MSIIIIIMFVYSAVFFSGLKILVRYSNFPFSHLRIFFSFSVSAKRLSFLHHKNCFEFNLNKREMRILRCFGAESFFQFTKNNKENFFVWRFSHSLAWFRRKTKEYFRLKIKKIKALTKAHWKLFNKFCKPSLFPLSNTVGWPFLLLPLFVSYATWIKRFLSQILFQFGLDAHARTQEHHVLDLRAY